MGWDGVLHVRAQLFTELVLTANFAFAFVPPRGSSLRWRVLVFNDLFLLLHSLHMRIGLILGTTRHGRQTEKVFFAVKQLLEKQSDLELVSLDLAELNLPIFTGEDNDHPGVKKLLDTYKRCDGFFIVTPEYNHGIPGVLKMALDFAQQKELQMKPLAIVSTSSGPYGGVRCVKQLEAAWLGLGGVCANLFLATPHVEAFHADAPPQLWLEQSEKFFERSLLLFKKFTKV